MRLSGSHPASEVNVRRWSLTVVAVAGVVLIACGGGGESTRVPVGPFEGATGAELYTQACATCHGDDLRGTDQGPPFLNPMYEPGHHADQAFVLAAMVGVRAHHWDFGNMPPIEGITQDQVLAIVDYVREQQRSSGID